VAHGNSVRHDRDKEQEPIMGESEVIQNLRKARSELMNDRANLAKILANLFDRQKTPHAIQTFAQVQETIEAIDKAIKDEASQSYGKVE
jgi:hypothetical protein